MNPFGFISMVERFALENSLKFKIFKDSELLEEKLNLIYGVGKGSINKPGLIVVEY
jgi:leucyl aminopeptidase